MLHVILLDWLIKLQSSKLSVSKYLFLYVSSQRHEIVYVFFHQFNVYNIVEKPRRMYFPGLSC